MTALQPDDSANAPCTRTMVGFSCATALGAKAAPDKARPAASARIPVTLLMCFLLVGRRGPVARRMVRTDARTHSTQASVDPCQRSGRAGIPGNVLPAAGCVHAGRQAGAA